jgi:hypothetical protein
MKTKLILFFCFFVIVSNAQEKIISGSVYDNEMRPIVGVLLISNNQIIAHTDSKGVFKFKNYKDAITINFSHLLFKSKTIRIKNRENNKLLIVKLKEQINQLDEIVLSSSNKKYTKREIIKKAIKNFEKKYRAEPYWSEINFKKTTHKQDTLHEYVEIDGAIFMQGKNKNVFDTPIVIPLQSRRMVINNSIKNHSLPTNNFLTYHFFEQIHPLNKKGLRNFDFDIEKKTLFNDELCYLIKYNEKKSISVNRMKMKFVRGQIWVTVNGFNIKRVTSLFQFSKGTNNVFTIDYVELENQIFPKNIFYDYYYLNYQQFSRYKGDLEFTKINAKPVENYRKKFKLFNQNYFITSNIYNIYNHEYWKKRTFKGYRFENELAKFIGKSNLDSIFSQGARNIIKLDKRFGVKILEEEKKLIKIMKTDLKN